MKHHEAAPRWIGPLPIMLLVGALLLVPSRLSGQDADQQRPPEIELRVDGLACPFCAQGLEKKLVALEGIERVTVLLDEALVRVWTQPGAHVDDQGIENAVKEAGFLLREIRRRPPF